MATKHGKYIIHSEFIGYMEVPSRASSQYILTMIVEKSRLENVYMLKSRSELQKCRFEYRAQVKRATGTSVESSHSDQHEEFISFGNIF